MKKLLISFLLIAAAFITQAQDVKPTKEESVQYIKNYLQDIITTSTYASNSRGTDEYSYRYLKIEFTDCKFNIELEETHSNDRSGTYRETKKIDKYVVDLFKTENLSGFFIQDNSGLSSEKSEYGLLRISFFSVNKSKIFLKNGEPVSEFSIPILRSTNTSKPLDDLFDSQIYKAFNHLRKLCGAPEPIKFD